MTDQFVDYMTAGDIKSESELRPGEGAIMRDGVSKVAVRAMRMGTCTSFQPCARISGVLSRGTRLSRPGTARVMVHGSVLKVEFIGTSEY